MTQPAAQLAAELRLRCPQCGGDVSLLPIHARFCPRCGATRISDPQPAAGEARVVEWHFEPPTLPGQGRPHSLIVLGYASAMNSLGTRYESGRGVHKNENEAVRCYTKAARLGNEHARVRLRGMGIEAPRVET